MSTYERVIDYEDEPVKYCPRCLSLKIKYEEIRDTEYCGDCGCTDIEEAPIDVWERKYKAKYGHSFVEKGNDPKKSPIFQMTRIELRKKVYDSPKWKNIIEAMYPSFPGGLSKIDSILLFFDKLIRENKLDDLKLLLIKMKI